MGFKRASTSPVSKDCGEAARSSLVVVIPTRNRPDDLEVTVKSVLSQTVLPERLIVVDQSGSSESWTRVSACIRGRAASGHLVPDLIYILDPAIPGLTAARNRALGQVAEEIVLFLDDDVILEPEFVEEILAVYRGHPEACGVGGIITNYAPPSPPFRCWTRLFVLPPFWDDRQPVYWRARRLQGAGPVRVTRLGGGLMSFRLAEIAGMRFDEGLTGACDGEDVEFCARLKPGSILLISPQARLFHKQTPVARSAGHWLERHARTFSYLYRRNWSVQVRHRLAYSWLRVGYGLAAVAASARQLSLRPWRETSRALQHPTFGLQNASHSGSTQR
jgi:GT2 family glycosyltransferase